MVDMIVIGAGPAGIATAAEAVAKGFKVQLLEKGAIAASICRYPRNMRFFSESSKLSVAGYPFVSQNIFPSRDETIIYYQTVARLSGAEIFCGTTAEEIVGGDNAFLVKCQDRSGRTKQLRAKKVVVASGRFDTPRQLYIPGEDLPHVSHYYIEPYEYEGSRVMVVGGGDSAAEAALELCAHNVKVMLSYRKMGFTRLKPWTLARLNRAITENKIELFAGSLLKEIQTHDLLLKMKERGDQRVEVDYLFLLTGHMPNVELLKRTGVTVDEGNSMPAFFEENLETNVSGLYLAGVVRDGIENRDSAIAFFQDEAERIVKDILSKM